MFLLILASHLQQPLDAGSLYEELTPRSLSNQARGPLTLTESDNSPDGSTCWQWCLNNKKYIGIPN